MIFRLGWIVDFRTVNSTGDVQRMISIRLARERLTGCSVDFDFLLRRDWTGSFRLNNRSGKSEQSQMANLPVWYTNGDTCLACEADAVEAGFPSHGDLAGNSKALACVRR